MMALHFALPFRPPPSLQAPSLVGLYVTRLDSYLNEIIRTGSGEKLTTLDFLPFFSLSVYAFFQMWFSFTQLQGYTTITSKSLFLFQYFWYPIQTYHA